MFASDGRYQAFKEQRHFRGDEDGIVDAVSVSAVDMGKSRHILCHVEMPSTSITESFTVLAVFTGTVTDPVAVVRNRTDDLVTPLTWYVRSQLRELLGHYDVDDVTTVRLEVAARLQAAYDITPLLVEGVSLVLVDVDVLTPEDVRQHVKTIQEERRAQEVEKLRTRFEEGKASRMAAVIKQGPEAAEGLAVTRGDISAGTAAERGYVLREVGDAKARQLFQWLLDRGALDDMPLDPAGIMDLARGVLPPGLVPNGYAGLASTASGSTPAVEAGRDDSEPGARSADEPLGEDEA